MVSAFGHQLFSLLFSALRIQTPSWQRPIVSSSHRGEDARMGRRGLQFRCKDIALFCYNKIKMELFSLICNIFLYSCLFVRYGVCERHPEGKNTATPCRNIFHAMRLEGCKEFLCWQCVMNGPMARRLRGYDGMTADYISFCRSFLKGLQGFLRKKARISPLLKT